MWLFLQTRVFKVYLTKTYKSTHMAEHRSSSFGIQFKVGKN